MIKILKSNNKDCNEVDYHLLDYKVINYKYSIKHKTISSKELERTNIYLARILTVGQ